MLDYGDGDISKLCICCSSCWTTVMVISLSCVSAVPDYRDGDISKLCIYYSSGLTTMMVISLSCVSIILQV